MEHESKIEILKQVSAAMSGGVSQSELELGFAKAKDASDVNSAVNAVREAIYKFRDQYKPSTAALTVDQSRALQEEYKLRATVELASDEKLSALQLEHTALGRRIDYESKLLTAAFSEYYSIPQRTEQINKEIIGLKSTVEELSDLDAIFSEAFQANLNGTPNRDFLTEVGAAIATRSLRLPLLADAISKKEAELKKIEARHRQLAKQLKQDLK